MQAKLTIAGTRPLLMSSQRAADPNDPLVHELKSLTKKGSKATDEDRKAISDLEFRLRIYHDTKIGPYLPGINLKRCIQDGGKKLKRGKDILRAIQPTEDLVPVLYKGPRDFDSLFADKSFRHVTFAKTPPRTGSIVQRTRPMFTQWAIEAIFEIDEDQMDLHEFRTFCENARHYGIGDYRPDFGRFEVVSVEAIRA